MALLLPAIHFAALKLTWKPSHYQTELTWSQLDRMTRSVLVGAGNLDFMAPGIVLVLIVLWNMGRKAKEDSEPGQNGLSAAWHRYRVIWITGLLLLVCGIGIYAPVKGVSGRYMVPAAWGADLWFGALAGCLLHASASVGRRLAVAALLCGFLGMGIANWIKQDKQAARTHVLWHTLRFVEANVPVRSKVVWHAKPFQQATGSELGVKEGIHFEWHLGGRGRRDIVFVNSLSSHAATPARKPRGKMEYWICGGGRPPADDRFQLLCTITAPFRLNMKSYETSVWTTTAMADD